jgi:competence protein ComFB
VQSEFRTNPQLSVDLVTLAHEGLRRVNAVKRSYYFPEENGTSTASVDGGPRFHYPAIRGRLFDCLTFAPVSGVDVWLRVDDKPVRMINSRWQNPYGLLDSSSGSYLFWPESSPADGKESRRVFEFELFVDESKRFEEFRHYFKIEVTASADADETLRLTRDFRLQDLFLVPR